MLVTCAVAVAACGSGPDGHGGGSGPVTETYIFPKIGQVMTAGEFLAAVG